MRKDEKITRAMFLPPPSNNWRPPSSNEISDEEGLIRFSKFMFLAMVFTILLVALIAGSSLFFIVEVINESMGLGWSFSWFDCLLIAFHVNAIRIVFGALSK